MTITVVRPVSAAGVWATNRKATRFVNGAGIVAPGTGIKVVRSGSGPAGRDAKNGFIIIASGVFGARAAILPAPIILAGSVAFTALASHARSFNPCGAQTVWDLTLDGTFASETQATDLEIAAAHFATITFPAGPGAAVIAYLTGGLGVDGQALRLWQSATPDASQNNTSITLAGP